MIFEDSLTWLHERSRRFQEGPRSSQNVPPGVQEGLWRAPGALQRRPRLRQEPLRSVQEAPGNVPEPHGRSPRALQEALQEAKGAKTRFWSPSGGSQAPFWAHFGTVLERFWTTFWSNFCSIKQSSIAEHSRDSYEFLQIFLEIPTDIPRDSYRFLRDSYRIRRQS